MTTETRKELRLEEWPVSNPVHALLVEARAYIADGSRWCQNAPDKGKKSCALGAIMRVYDRRTTKDANTAMSLLNQATHALYLHPYIGIVQVNDRLGHAAVLRCYDFAIAESLRETR